MNCFNAKTVAVLLCLCLAASDHATMAQEQSETMTDQEVLLAWKATLPPGDCLGCQDGPVFRSWTKDANICDWKAVVAVSGETELVERGVTKCSKDKRKATKLELSYMDISGPLPTILSKLDELSDLELQRNLFTGTLPGEWVHMGENANSVEIDVSRNVGISGKLPVSWSQNPKLRRFFASGCSLSGPLPAEWASFSKLSSVILMNNRLMGPLPAEWADLPNLRTLMLPGNDFSGTLPKAWSGMSSMGRMDLTNNELTGTIPADWSKMHEITQLLLSENELSGTVPKELSTLSNVPPMLTAFDFSENRIQIDGDWFPETWDAHPQRDEGVTDAAEAVLEWVESLPTGGCLGCRKGPVLRNFTRSRSVCDWQDFVLLPGEEQPQQRGVVNCNSAAQQIVKLDLTGMEIGGRLPERIHHQKHLEALYLGLNSFTGTLPSQWSSLGILGESLALRLNNNLLTGTLPISWKDHPSLYKINLHKNKLSGPVPGEWSEMEELQSVNLGSNDLTGTLPASWAELEDMRRITLSNNKLAGELPAEWAEWTELTFMDLSRNSFESSIPSEWSQFTGAELDLTKNNLAPAPLWTPALWGVDAKVQPPPRASEDEEEDSRSSIIGWEERQPVVKTQAASKRTPAESTASGGNNKMKPILIVLGVCVAFIAVMTLFGWFVMSRRATEESKRLNMEGCAEAPSEIAMESILLDGQELSTSQSGTYLPPVTDSQSPTGA